MWIGATYLHGNTPQRLRFSVVLARRCRLLGLTLSASVCGLDRLMATHLSSLLSLPLWETPVYLSVVQAHQASTSVTAQTEC